MGDFQKLKVWQRGKDLAVYIYKAIGKSQLAKDYCLKDQIWRSSVSVPSNIAEGEESGTTRQSVNFFRISKGSTAEVLSQAVIANEIGYFTNTQFDHIKEECQAISSMLTNLIRAREKS
jgi:four helix bundle protein